MNDALMKKAKTLVDAISLDVNGLPGMPFSGNGGLVSDATIKAADALRLAMAVELTTDKGWAVKFLDAAATWFESLPTTEDQVHWANRTNAENCRRIKEML